MVFQEISLQCAIEFPKKGHNCKCSMYHLMRRDLEEFMQPFIREMQLRRTKTEKIQQPEKLIILFSKLFFYALSWPKLNFGY